MSPLAKLKAMNVPGLASPPAPVAPPAPATAQARAAMKPVVIDVIAEAARMASSTELAQVAAPRKVRLIQRPNTLLLETEDLIILGVLGRVGHRFGDPSLAHGVRLQVISVDWDWADRSVNVYVAPSK